MKLNAFGLCLIALALGAIATPASYAQGTPAPPTKRSFSNPPPAPAAKPATENLKPVSQEDLTDAVLGDTMQLLWEQADEHGHLGESDHAINLCKIIVQADPHNMEAFSTAAYWMWSLGRANEAETLLQQGIAANPSTYYMYGEMGNYWALQRKDPKTAIPYYEKAIKYDCPWQIWNSLANSYERTGQLERAVFAWEKAAFYPQDPVAGRRLKQARAKLAQQKSGR